MLWHPPVCISSRWSFLLSQWYKINRLEPLLTIHSWDWIDQGVCLRLCFACQLHLQSLVARTASSSNFANVVTLLPNSGLGTHLPGCDLFKLCSNCLANRLCSSDLSELLMIFCPTVSPTYIAIASLGGVTPGRSTPNHLWFVLKLLG